jgi:DNA repair protein RadA/Sms
MAKSARSTFVCQNCGATSARWQGKCPDCGEWNTLAEEADVAAAPGSGLAKGSKVRPVALEGLRGASDEAPRMPTGLAELDRVTGGGIVPGSAILVGGEPGIGKSTLLLQLVAELARGGRRTIYFTGEEATAQVRMRAERLGLADAPSPWRRRPTCRPSSQPWLPNDAWIWSWSIRSRPCGPTRSIPRRAR